MRVSSLSSFFFFFNDTATTEIYTLSLHDALPISDEARANAEKTRAQAEAQQAEVAKSMKFLQKKAVDVLDREEKMRKKEAEVDEKERLLEGKFEIVETKERSLEAEGEEQAQKLARMEAELEKMRTRLAEAEKGGKVAADVEERNKDLESRLKIIQRKAMELLDREEKVRGGEEALKDGAEKRG